MSETDEKKQLPGPLRVLLIWDWDWVFLSIAGVIWSFLNLSRAAIYSFWMLLALAHLLVFLPFAIALKLRAPWVRLPRRLWGGAQLLLLAGGITAAFVLPLKIPLAVLGVLHGMSGALAIYSLSKDRAVGLFEGE